VESSFNGEEGGERKVYGKLVVDSVGGGVWELGPVGIVFIHASPVCCVMLFLLVAEKLYRFFLVS